MMRIVTGEEMSAVDRYTIEKIGMPGTMLMENAGRAVAARLLQHYPASERFLILIGSGNNGGDGFVIARTLKDANRDVHVCVIPPEERFKGDAKFHKELFEKAGYTWTSYNSVYFLKTDIVVDALLGTGVSGEIREPYRGIIQEISAADKLTVSVDLPSGVPSDETPMPTDALQADRTITLQQPKLSYYTYPARDYYGDTEVVSIGIPPRALQAVINTKRYLWTKRDVINHWKPRSASSHKGSHGKTGIIAGSETMPGAAALVAGAAANSGAGLTTVNTPKEAISSIAAHVPEATYYYRQDNFKSFYENKDGIAIGPGIGVGAEGEGMVAELIANYDAPLVVDADGLHQLSGMLDKVRAREHPLIITPHPGEMAALLDTTPEEINQNRFEIAESFARKYQLYVVLKGSCTLVATPEGETWINDTGNAGLAKGGTGDVLTGMILAFVARYTNIQAAISSAVYMHGFTADDLLEQGMAVETMTASDIVGRLPVSFRGMDRGDGARK